MATPISNNNPAIIANNKSPHSEERSSLAQPRVGESTEPSSSPQKEAAVNVSRAAQILSQSSVDRTQGNIMNAEQAAAVAGQIKELLQQNPAAALAGQAGNVPSSIMDLLKAG